MVAELHAETETCDQVDDKDGVHFDGVASADDVEHPHAAHELEEDQEDTEADEDGKWQTRQHLKDCNDNTDTDGDVLEADTVNVGVLVVVDKEQTVCECDRCLGFSWLRRQLTRRNADRFAKLLQVAFPVNVLVREL